MEFKQRTLSNGLNIIAEVNKNALSAAVGFFVKTGSRDETDDISGVSHFLEHMLFKGTDKLSWLDVNEAFDRAGAKFNAFTAEENTVYYAAVLPEYLKDVTSLWSELMRPSLSDDDFNMEKNVIKQEIAMYKDLPAFDVLDQARALHFGKHPCGKSILGTPESIDKLTSEQMRNYFNSRYSPNNITVSFAGNIDFDEISSLVETKTTSWSAQDAPRETEFFDGTFQKKRIKKAALNCEHIALVSPSPSMQDQNRFTASVMANIIGDATGSRFFWALVDSAIAEEAVMQYEAMDGAGVVYTYICVSKNNAEKAMKIVDNILAEVTSQGVSEAELATAKNKLLSAITIKNEIPMGRLLELGFNWVYLKKYIAIDEVVKTIKSITTEQVNSLLKQYKLTDYSCVSIIPE